MAGADRERKRAWESAHKILSLARVDPAREGADLLEIGTREICRAMGQPAGAKLEDVSEI